MHVKLDTELREDDRLTVMSKRMASTASLVPWSFFGSWFGQALEVEGILVGTGTVDGLERVG